MWLAYGQRGVIVSIYCKNPSQLVIQCAPGITCMLHDETLLWFDLAAGPLGMLTRQVESCSGSLEDQLPFPAKKSYLKIFLAEQIRYFFSKTVRYGIRIFTFVYTSTWLSRKYWTIKTIWKFCCCFKSYFPAIPWVFWPISNSARNDFSGVSSFLVLPLETPSFPQMHVHWICNNFYMLLYGYWPKGLFDRFTCIWM